jgi:CheY-like chemotaxis protein
LKQAPALHVLVIEDHAPLQEQIAALLQRAGHRVDKAASGAVALRLALAQPPDVTLLDIGLPELNGLSIVRRLLERHVGSLHLNHSQGQTRVCVDGRVDDARQPTPPPARQAPAR